MLVENQLDRGKKGTGTDPWANFFNAKARGRKGAESGRAYWVGFLIGWKSRTQEPALKAPHFAPRRLRAFALCFSGL